MAGDWDLYAVVRSCTSAANTATSAIASNRFLNGNNSSWREDPLACLASLTFKEEDDPFTFPNLRKSDSLQDSYQPFLSHADPIIIGTNRGIDPSSSRSVNGGSSGQHYQHQRLQQLEQEQSTTKIGDIGISSPLTPTSAPIFSLHQQQEVKRSRKRKKQQKRNVCHVTADNLSSDPWAWRKYGQKPIKGSPYPRNYYRCSSSKGCLARKQVERSNLYPNIFTVTYTGDHTHPRPTHRNSLAGSTRNKLSTIQKAANASCSSPRSATSLSPISRTTSLSAPKDTAAAHVHDTGDNGGKDERVDNMALETSPDAENGDEDDLLIPNLHMDDDLFKGLEELVGGAAGASSTSSGLGPSRPALGDNFSS